MQNCRVSNGYFAGSFRRECDGAILCIFCITENYDANVIKFLISWYIVALSTYRTGFYVAIEVCFKDVIRCILINQNDWDYLHLKKRIHYFYNIVEAIYIYCLMTSSKRLNLRPNWCFLNISICIAFHRTPDLWTRPNLASMATILFS